MYLVYSSPAYLVLLSSTLYSSPAYLVLLPSLPCTPPQPTLYSSPAYLVLLSSLPCTPPQPTLYSSPAYLVLLPSLPPPALNTLLQSQQKLTRFVSLHHSPGKKMAAMSRRMRKAVGKLRTMQGGNGEGVVWGWCEGGEGMVWEW